jgi:hypothetical protein
LSAEAIALYRLPKVRMMTVLQMALSVFIPFFSYLGQYQIVTPVGGGGGGGL